MHSTPYNNFFPTKIKTKNPSPAANPSKKESPIDSSNKSDWVTNISYLKSPLCPSHNQSTNWMKSNRKTSQFSHKSMKMKMFHVKSIEISSSQKLPPFGSINSPFTKSKKKNSKSFLKAQTLKSRSFTWNIETLLLNPTWKTHAGNFVVNARYLTKISCRRILRGDVNVIMRIHEFLEKHGIINFSINYDGNYTFKPNTFSKHHDQRVKPQNYLKSPPEQDEETAEK